MALNDTLPDIMYAFFKNPGAFSTKWLNGDGAPSGATNGRTGDFYLNNLTGDLYYYDGDSWDVVSNLNTATGITDHGALTGLADDDHMQYHNDARGDARYPLKTALEFHAAQHAEGGTDPVTLTQAQITGLVAALAALAPLSSPILTGNPVAPTPSTSDNDTSVATTAFVKAVAASYATLASPALTGNPTAPTPAAGDNDTSIATTAFAAERAMVGNLLTANQASVETDATGWVGYSAATVAASTATSAHGSSCLLITQTGTGANSGAASQNPARILGIIPGLVYTTRALVKAVSGTRAYKIGIQWYDAADASLGIVGTTRYTPTTGAWIEVASWMVAPAGAAKARMYIRSDDSGSIGDAVYVDQCGLWAGAGGEWAMPGTPITNLGTKVSHPNVDDVLVQRWDSSLATPRWQTIHYDSGWRDVKAGVLNGWALWTGVPGDLSIRRIGGVVYLSAQLVATSATNDSFYALPTGFRPPSGARIWGEAAQNSATAWAAAEANGNNDFARSTARTGATFVTLTFATRDDIPTSLPGTLVSAAPA